MVCTKKRRLDQPAIEEVGQVVEVPDVVALELEAGAVALAEVLSRIALDVGRRCCGRCSRASFEVGRFPVEFVFLDAVGHREAAEVHRAHVERAHLGLGRRARGEALLQRHALAAAGGDVDDGVAACLDLGRNARTDRASGWVCRSPGCARAGGGSRRRPRRRRWRFGDLLRRDRQIGRLRRHMDRAGHGAGDDDFSSATGRQLLAPSLRNGRSSSRNGKGERVIVWEGDMSDFKKSPTLA